MITAVYILARALQFGSCLLFFGVFAFDRFVAAPALAGGVPDLTGYWASRRHSLSGVALGLIGVSGLAWFVMATVTMSGEPLRAAFAPAMLGTVWHQTHFGAVWQWRSVFALGALVSVGLLWRLRMPSVWHRALLWAQLVWGGLLLGSLAWAGHGQEGHPAQYHLAADALHLLVAGCWPTGLLPLALLLAKLRPTPPSFVGSPARLLVGRFSILSLGSVALLILTGWVNGWFLVGSWANLFERSYGRWLLVKIGLFGLAIVLGAVNLLRLKPRLSRATDLADANEATDAAAHLRFNVRVELALGTAIVIVVAILGMLPPAVR